MPGDPRVGRALLGQLADGAYEETQARYRAEDLLAGLQHRYGGSAADAYALQVEDIERRLDREWPGWRTKTPYNHLPQDARDRVNVWLTRRRQIFVGMGALGVRVVQKLNGKRPVVPVRPSFAAQVAAREPLAIDPMTPNISIPWLAYTVGVPLERAEAAMLDFNPAIERNQLQHIRNWCAAHPEEVADAAAP